MVCASHRRLRSGWAWRYNIQYLIRSFGLVWGGRFLARYRSRGLPAPVGPHAAAPPFLNFFAVRVRESHGSTRVRCLHARSEMYLTGVPRAGFSTLPS